MLFELNEIIFIIRNRESEFIKFRHRAINLDKSLLAFPMTIGIFGSFLGNAKKNKRSCLNS